MGQEVESKVDVGGVHGRLAQVGNDGRYRLGLCLSDGIAPGSCRQAQDVLWLVCQRWFGVPDVQDLTARDGGESEAGSGR